MSGFFGIFNPKGGAINTEAFEQMKAAADHPGHDGIETYIDDNIAIGHVMLRVSPESQFDQQPLKSSCLNYILVGHFRLDYRDELGDKLGLTNFELKNTPDSRLVMMAYQKWKEKCVLHIEGDFVFAIIGRCNNTIFIAKDRSGISALYYFIYENSLYFSTSSMLFDKIKSQKYLINLSQLCRISLPGIGPLESQTLYTNVFYLTYAETIFINASLKIKSKRYWGIDSVAKIEFKYIDDYIDEVLNFLTQAIKSRIRSSNKVGIFLSGGNDSSAVAAISSLELMYKHENLYSFTSYPSFQTKLSKDELQLVDERIGVEQFVDHFKNVEPEYLDFPNVKISELLNSKWTGDIFSPNISFNTYWIIGALEKAKNKGLKLMLNGQLGNFTISTSVPFIFFDLLKDFRIFKMFQHIVNLRKLRKQSLLKILKIFIYLPLISFLKSKVKSLFLFSTLYFRINKHFKLEVYKKANIVRVPNDFLGIYSPLLNSRKLRKARLNKNLPISSNIWYRYNLEYGIENLDPTADARLINLTFSFPEEIYFSGVEQKPIFFQMLKKISPVGYSPKFSGAMQAYDFPIRMKNDDGLKLFFEQIKTNRQIANVFSVDHIENQFNSLSISDEPQKERLATFRLINQISLISFFLSKKGLNL
jgi:asparagine synthase (glutamine-hydrolysing)